MNKLTVVALIAIFASLVELLSCPPTIALGACTTNQCDPNLAEVEVAAANVHTAITNFNNTVLALNDPHVQMVFSLFGPLDAKAEDVQTVSGIPPSADVEALVFIVMMNAANDMNKDLQDVMAEVKDATAAKQGLRPLLNSINEDGDIAARFDNVISTTMYLLSLFELHCADCST